jgi:hypothetical protein
VTRAAPFSTGKSAQPRGAFGQRRTSSIAASGLTSRKCREMQRVVLFSLMEKRHDPAAAKEVLEALGLAQEFPVDGSDDTVAVSLLWSRAEVST